MNPSRSEFVFVVMDPRTGATRFHRGLPEGVNGKVLQIIGNHDAVPVEIPTSELTWPQYLAWERRMQALGFKLVWIGIQ